MAEALDRLTRSGAAEQRQLIALLTRLHDQQDARLMQLRRDNDAAVQRTVWGTVTVAVLALLSLAAFAAAAGRSRARLQESQARFRQLAETMPQLAWIAREDGYITWYNQRWYDYTGTTPQQMEGWGWQAVHDPAELPRVMEEWQGAIDARQPVEMIFPLRGADGVLRPFLTRVAPLKDDAGRVVAWFGTNTDISEQQATADALRESERRERERAEVLEAVMRAVPAAIWIAKDADAHDVEGNPESYRLLRLPLDSNASATAPAGVRQQRGFIECRDGRPVPPHELPLQKAASTGREVTDTELQLVFDDGEVRWIHGSAAPLRHADGTVRGAVAAFVDITSRKLAEERLREREEELQTLTDNTPDILTRFDRQLRHLFVNAAVTRATGRPVSDFIGKTNRELGMDPELCDRWDACLRAVFETGQPQTVDFTFDSPDGPRHFQGRFIPEFDDDGHVVSALGVTHDRTAEKIATDALLEADRRKDEFLATLAHELRNPLTPIRTGLHILQRTAGGQPADPTTARILDMMNRQVGHMVRLIDDLLDVARISTGKIELKRERVLLSTVLDSALDTSRPLIEAARHAVETDLPAEPVWLLGDAVRLAQVVSNLLNNAAKYTPDHGRIRLAAEVRDQAVDIIVTDNGIGIPPAELSRIFSMFAQVGPALERSHGGLGIGLALVQRLVEMHGGRVRAESAGPGQGSRFVVTLPLATQAQAGGAPATPDGAPRPTPAVAAIGWRVLVVDDNTDAAESLGAALQLAGHDVRIEHDGPRGLLLAQAWQPRAVLLDIGMPGMDGFEVARRLRAMAGSRPLLLAAITGWGSEDMRQRAREAGFDLHLTKPVDPAEVVDVLARQVQGPAAEPGPPASSAGPADAAQDADPSRSTAG